MGRFDGLGDVDVTLVAMIGDLEAFDELARRYRPAVTSTARAIARDGELVRDVVQDVLIAAYTKLHTLRDPRAFGAWLRVMTERQTRRAVAGERRRAEPVEPLHIAVYLACPSVRPDAEVTRDEQRALVRQAIASLHPEDAELVELRYIDGVPLGRIADYLGITRDGAKWRLQRANSRLRKALRHLLEDEEVVNHGYRAARAVH